MQIIADMPLEQLKTYQGTNPCPPDFDDFWDRGLAEMRSLDPQLEIVPAEFHAANVECFHMYFNGVGGARIHAKLWRPTNFPEPHPALIISHGYSIDSGDWSGKLVYASQGITVACLDVRGQAGKSVDVGDLTGTTLRGHTIRGLEDGVKGHPEKQFFRNVYLDNAQLTEMVMAMPEVDPDRVGAYGISQGGGLTVVLAGLEPRIKRAIPVIPFLGDFQRVWEMDQGLTELKEYFRLMDPLHKTEQAVFNALGYIDMQNFAHRIRAEVCWVLGLVDAICPPSTQFAAYNKITSPKSMVLFPDYGHEFPLMTQDIVFEFLTGL